MSRNLRKLMSCSFLLVRDASYVLKVLQAVVMELPDILDVIIGE